MLNTKRYNLKKNFLVKNIEKVTVKEDTKPEKVSLEESKPKEEHLTKLEGKQIN